jgi:ribosomal protein S18 acetylase RimI-like enzyme
MSHRFRIAPASGTEDLQVVADLFRGYAASLPVDLGYQAFDDELAALPGKYAPPTGALLLARDAGGAALGCVGLRGLDQHGVCEMKRLYLLPAARGLGLGRALADAIALEARRLGYRELRLDTLPSMARAIAIYRQMGFSLIEPYYQPTPPGTVFMALKL